MIGLLLLVRIAVLHRCGQEGVALSDCRSVCLSVMIVIPAEMAEPIEMPFGIWTQVCQGNHVLGGGPDMRGASLRGELVAHCKLQGPCRELWKNGCTN